MKHTAFVAIAAAFGLWAAPVEAAPFLFTITGAFEAQFQLESSPTPDFAIDGYVFVLNGVPGFSGATTGLADIGFYNSDANGGMLAYDSDTGDALFDASGPQVYADLESAPTFLPGSYAMTDGLTGGNFTLTITGVPEPASWALMIGGMALAGAAMRRRPELHLQTA